MTNYDPTKKYTWSLEDEFTLSGKDFGLMLNTIRALLNTEEAIRYQLLFKTNEMIENVMSEAANSGKIKEVPDSPAT